MSTIKYTVITPDKFQDVIAHLRYNFFVDEPLNKCLDMSKPGEPHKELEEFSGDILNQGLSFMAVDSSTGQVAGVILNGSSSSENYPKRDYKDQKLLKVFNFFENIEKDLEFLQLNLKDILEVKILSVDTKFRKQGIAKTLYSLTEKDARSKGYKILMTHATSFFSQRVFLGLGFEMIKEIMYNEYPSKDAPTFHVAPPHVSYKLLVKHLN